MTTTNERLALLRRWTARCRQGDKPLSEETADLREVMLQEADGPEALEQAIVQESIILRRERPVLAIHDNAAQLDFVDPADSAVWRARLQQARPMLEQAIRAVGRIDLVGGRLDWVGTGWLVADGIVVTNRHVANEFAEPKRNGQGLSFRVGDDGPMHAALDFLQEIDNPARLVFRLVKPLHIEPAPGPDLAFFEVELVSGESRLATPIALATHLQSTANAATIGYPAYDSRIPDTELMESIYGRVYNKKRLAPGGVTRVQELRVLHDCTTLGGNSGSVVLDLDSGQALGLHFSGSFMATNHAVRADVVGRLLADVRAGRVRPAQPPAASQRQAPVPAPGVGAERPALAGPGAGSTTLSVPLSTTLTIPLTVTVTLGGAWPAVTAAVPLAPPSAAPAAGGGGDDIEETEAVAEDYRDRKGYDPEFLGAGPLRVDLPSVDRHRRDVLAIDGQPTPELRYEHYSVVMSRSRRMCFFSAVNIDGKLSRKSRRSGWRWDPRLPRQQQIMQECYGSPPRFSRGHMTRREDPAWGNAQTAQRGSDDSMHVTNTTPQMQAFNSPIWLALESYALDHARSDAMRISVFTGPVFRDDDPVMYGVQIPTAFWKVIAFVHDRTGALCATGYQMSQRQSLQPEEEFVFGAFQSTQLNMATQVPIRTIEARSGMAFNRLAAADPLAGAEEGVHADSERRLLTLDGIRFLR